MFKINQILCEGASEVNEDIIGYGDDFAIILDGSTGLRKKHLDNVDNLAKWYVTNFIQVISKYISKDASLYEVVITCIDEVKNLLKKIHPYKIEKIDLPSASISIIRLNNNRLEVFSLGDCTTIIKYKTAEIITVYDNTVTKLDNEVIEEMINLRKRKGINIIDTRNLVNELLIKNRYKKNTENGYWILGFEKEAVKHAYYKEFDLEKIDKVYMMSDGMAEYYEELGIVSSVNEFIDELDTKGVDTLYREMRKVQEEDNLCNKYPRIKPKDDASLIVCQI